MTVLESNQNVRIVLMMKVICCFLTFTSLVHARSNSVISSVACSNMTPIHGESQPQKSIAKVQIVPHAFKLKRGREIKLSLHTTSASYSFRGFLIQARKTETNEDIENFISRNCNVILCGSSYLVASHQNPLLKSSQILVWKAPNNVQGSVRFQ